MQRGSARFSSLTEWQQGVADAQLRTRVDQLLSRCDMNASVACDGFESSGHSIEVVNALSELGAEADLATDALEYVARQIDGTALPDDSTVAEQLATIDQLEDEFRETGGASGEGMRRLLLALVSDVRALLIILADRLVKLRAAADADDESQLRFARRVQSIHAPLANRLGIWQFKWELEDYVFRYTQPELYRRIARLLHEKRLDRERYIEHMIDELDQQLLRFNIKGDIKGRPKHIYSIWRKMQRKNLPFDELYDVRAVRVLVNDVSECYAALGLVHGAWQPIPGEFDDYIANPKPNGYRSLHTAVFGPEGKPVEIQIRTRAMHDEAELGVAAHWRYKEGGGHDPGFQRKLNAMRQLIEGGGDDESLLEDFTAEEDEHRVDLLTPQGKVIDLKSGSTVLDFAYHIHTDIGHRCRGAKINGRIVPLDTKIRNGQQVEILTAREGGPSRDWMVEKHGFLISARARSKVRQWFKRVDFDRNVADGRDLLEREFKRFGLRDADVAELAPRFSKSDATAVYAALGLGEITPAQIANAVQRRAEEEGKKDADLTLDRSEPVPDTPSSSDEVLIDGVGGLLSTIARCCSPVPGDEIVGYLTRRRGISIHRASCKSLAGLVARDASRVMDVSWGRKPRGAYKAEIKLTGYDRQQLLSDISRVLTDLKVAVISLQTNTDDSRGQTYAAINVRVAGFEQLGIVMTRLSGIKGVIEVRRSG